MREISLPPLFSGLDSAGADPFALACARAREGCDAGLVVYEPRPDMLRAAIVFAPEVPLRDAAVMLPVCAVGLQNAFGAIAPPEVSLHVEWGGSVRVNGGVAGRLRMAAHPPAREAEPDWLAIGLELAFWAPDGDTGLTPDVTALHAEGCGEMEVPHLLEAWVRHTLVWINRWSEDGPRPLHREWIGIAHGLNATATLGAREGTFVGVDETFGMILRSGARTTIIPLTDLLEAP
jgi:biotin-(acetyl-CoA carboxylase) ligase